VNHHTNGIVAHHIERLPAITAAALRAGRRRAADQSQSLSRAGAMAAAAGRCNEAVNRLIVLAYEVDEHTGSLANVDAATGVFERFPMPWSGRYYRRWGLMRTEADVLAIHVKALHDLTIPPLWTYDAATRRWGVNLWDYETQPAALAYWRRCELSAKDFQMIAQSVRNRRAK
jgi:hypothetical protein